MSAPFSPQALSAYLGAVHGRTVSELRVTPLGGGRQGDKGYGYGIPLRVDYTLDGTLRRAVVVERDDGRALWLPYVQVSDIAETSARALWRGARVELEPREGPAGWRCVLAAPAGAEVALWQPKG